MRDVNDTIIAYMYVSRFYSSLRVWEVSVIAYTVLHFTGGVVQ